MTSFWDNIEVGANTALGTHHFTADEIRRFAAKFDPQPFHLDEEAARASVLGGLCASGWHTAAVSMRLKVDHEKAMAEAWIKGGNPAPTFGPSPGITNLKWPKPVFAGDTIAFSGTVTGKRLSESRPGWGVVQSSMSGVNQHGATVFGFEAAVFMRVD